MRIDFVPYRKTRLTESASIWTSPTQARVEYIAFASSDGCFEKTPLLFLGGAFQNFNSFRKEVETFTADRPVLLVDLPSQGGNRQLLPTAEFEDLAHLLGEFLTCHNIERVIPIGLSYGSAIAFNFAKFYPYLVEKLILGGATTKLRRSFEILLHETFRALDLGQRERFAHGIVVNLINYGRRSETEIPDRFLTAFCDGLLRLDDHAILCYRQNCERIFRAEKLEGQVDCPTLVFTGEHDHFTLPQENAELIINSLPAGTFALVKGGDHLLNLERRDTVIALYEAFLKNQNLDQIPGIRIPHAASVLEYDSRQIPRIKTPGLTSLLADVPVEIDDLSLLGCRMTTTDLMPQSFLNFKTQDLHLQLPNGPKLSAHWAEQAPKPRLLFAIDSSQQMQALENFIHQYGVQS